MNRRKTDRYQGDLLNGGIFGDSTIQAFIYFFGFLILMILIVLIDVNILSVVI